MHGSAHSVAQAADAVKLAERVDVVLLNNNWSIKRGNVRPADRGQYDESRHSSTTAALHSNTASHECI